MNRVECAEQNNNQVTGFLANEKFHEELHSHQRDLHSARHHQSDHNGSHHAAGHIAAGKELDFNAMREAVEEKGNGQHGRQELQFDDLWAAVGENVTRPAVESARSFAQTAGEGLGNLMNQIGNDPFVHHVAHDICQDDPVREAVVIGIPALTVGALTLPFDTAVGGACAVGAFGLTVFGGIPMAIESVMRGK